MCFGPDRRWQIVRFNQLSRMVASTSTERKQKQRVLDRADPYRKYRKFDSLFMFGCVEIAIILDICGDIWFRGVDLAKALEIKNYNSAISENIDNKYTKKYADISMNIQRYKNIPGMQPKTTFVNETGMNLFILRSRMPKAEAFSQWVCGVILPKMRKTMGTKKYIDEYNKFSSTYQPEKKIGYFYIACSPYLLQKECVKIGKTLDLNARLSSYNCGRHNEEFMYYIYFKPMDSVVLDEYEKNVKIWTREFIYNGEILQCSMEKILSIIEYNETLALLDQLQRNIQKLLRIL